MMYQPGSRGRRRRAVPLLAGLAVIGLAACNAPQGTAGSEAAGDDPAMAVYDDPDMIENGREIAETQCATCHAVGANGESPRTDAPPLRTVLADYDPDALAEDFREGIHVGHPDMPDFDFGPIGTDSILAYLLSIQENPGDE